MTNNYHTQEEMVKRMIEIQNELVPLEKKGVVSDSGPRTPEEETRYQELSKELLALDMTLKAREGRTM